jgi:L-asparaginase II
MTAHPEMVGGVDRDVTIWMDAVPGLVAKEGADGVMVVGLVDGRAGALKIADGSNRARQAATVELLRRVGVDVDGALADVAERVAVPTFGHGREVGSLRPLAWD